MKFFRPSPLLFFTLGALAAAALGQPTPAAAAAAAAATAETTPPPFAAFYSSYDFLNSENFATLALPLTTQAYCEHFIGRISPLLAVRGGLSALEGINASAAAGGSHCLDRLVEGWDLLLATAAEPGAAKQSVAIAHENPKRSGTIQVSTKDVVHAVQYLQHHLSARLARALREGQAADPAAFCRRYVEEQGHIRELGRILMSPSNRQVPITRSSPQAMSQGLSEAETYALQLYTGSFFSVINPAIWKGALTAEQKRYAAILEQAMARFPVYRGNVRRFANLPPPVLAAHQPGAIVNYEAFTSTSANPGFLWGGSHQFTIQAAYRGRHIAGIRESGPGGEDEVLFPPGTRFKVISRQEQANGAIHFVLVEVEESGQWRGGAP